MCTQCKGFGIFTVLECMYNSIQNWMYWGIIADVVGLFWVCFFSFKVPSYDSTWMLWLKFHAICLCKTIPREDEFSKVFSIIKINLILLKTKTSALDQLQVKVFRSVIRWQPAFNFIKLWPKLVYRELKHCIVLWQLFQ